MFEHKHEIMFKNAEKIWLFGEDYFGDKSVFWNVHQTTLKNLCEKVSEIGFPIEITDLQFQKTIIIRHKTEFKSWFESNQPFKMKNLESY